MTKRAAVTDMPGADGCRKPYLKGSTGGLITINPHKNQQR